MPAFCLDCGEYVATGSRCPQHAAAVEAGKLARRQSSGRSRRRWGRVRAVAIARAGGRCERCGATEHLEGHDPTGLHRNPDDVEVLCDRCHGSVSAGRRAS